MALMVISSVIEVFILWFLSYFLRKLFYFFRFYVIYKIIKVCYEYKIKEGSVLFVFWVICKRGFDRVVVEVIVS